MKFRVPQTAAAAIALLMAAPVWSEEKPPESKEIEYQTFQNAKLKLHAWSGKKVTFLTQNAGVDPKLMQELCTTFDGIYDFYFEATGKAPQQIKHYEGRLTVAEVNETCGAACGYLGATGGELSKGCFADLSNGYQKGKTVDQVPPYEFGRNFWFYHPQLAYQKPVFVNKLWKAAEKRPAAKSTQDAVDNFIIAASQAAGKDLSEQFTKWRWPLSEQGRSECAKSKPSA